MGKTYDTNIIAEIQGGHNYKWHWNSLTSMLCVISYTYSKEKKSFWSIRHICLFTSLLLPPITLEPTFFSRILTFLQFIYDFVVVCCLSVHI